MSDSLVFYWDRADSLKMIDPDVIPHFDDIHPVLAIVVDVINAGYEGVIVDEQRLGNGRYFQALNVNLATPEGRIISAIQSSFEAGEVTPSAREVVEAINYAYMAGESDE
jgi:hypothetical protein